MQHVFGAVACCLGCEGARWHVEIKAWTLHDSSRFLKNWLSSLVLESLLCWPRVIVAAHGFWGWLELQVCIKNYCGSIAPQNSCRTIAPENSCRSIAPKNSYRILHQKMAAVLHQN